MSGACCACFAIRSSFVEMVVKLGVSVILPSLGSVKRFPDTALRSAGSLGRLPRLRRYYGGAPTSRCPTLLTCARLAVPVARSKQDLSSSLVTLAVHAVLSDRGRPMRTRRRGVAPDSCLTDVAFRGVLSRRLPPLPKFRSPITRPAPSLPTLRSKPPCSVGVATQGSLPDGGAPLAGRDSNPLGHSPGFSFVLASTWHPPGQSFLTHSTDRGETAERSDASGGMRRERPAEGSR